MQPEWVWYVRKHRKLLKAFSNNMLQKLASNALHVVSYSTSQLHRSVAWRRLGHLHRASLIISPWREESTVPHPPASTANPKPASTGFGAAGTAPRPAFRCL
jgi:hypothetical protein